MEHDEIVCLWVLCLCCSGIAYINVFACIWNSIGSILYAWISYAENPNFDVVV